MKNWLKQNLVLAVGLTLPLLLILLFFVASVLPKMLSTPPQFDVLFTVMDYNVQKQPEYSLEYSVKDRRVLLKTKAAGDKQNYGYNRPRLMLYDVKAETLREVRVDESLFADGAEIVPDEVKTWEVDTNSVAPDGYALDGFGSHYSGGLVGGLFGGGYRSGYRLKKGAAAYKIPQTYPEYYYGQMQFVGWVVKK